MCNHEYQRLGYLMIYASDEFSPIRPRDEIDIEGAYSGHTGVAPSILVYQCYKCGNVKLSNGVLDKVCRNPSKET